MPDTLSQNLQFLCAERPSVAQVCRDIGINHQQFSKYLSGRSRPSPHNLRRIARYFGLSDTALLDPHEGLVATYRRQTQSLTEQRRDPLAVAFPGDLPALRPYLGAYLVHFVSPAAPGCIIVNAAFLDEREGMVHSRLVETILDDTDHTRRWTRCDGKAAYHSDRIFVIDYEARNQGAFAMSILIPPHRQKKNYLFGKMTFLASLPRREPAASDVVWKKVGGHRTPREVIVSCGIYPEDSRSIDPVIRSYLASGGESDILGD